jgi:transmembrane sensor
MESEERYDRILAEAVAWCVCLSHDNPSTTDWSCFVDWLEADPSHNAAYDAVSLADAAYGAALEIEHSAKLHAENDDEPESVSEMSTRRWIAGAALLGIAALTFFALPFFSEPKQQKYETRPGETRIVSLPDGSQIALNGDTQIKIDATSHRFAQLVRGEAAFMVKHDTTRPFIVDVAGAKLQDVGTTFNVKNYNGIVDVAVAEGAVRYNPDSQAISLVAGDRLRMTKANPLPVVTKADPLAAIGWRERRLTYQNADLVEIVGDLSRAIGTQGSVSPALSDRKFSGVIRIGQDQSKLFHRLEALLSVHVQHRAKGWQLIP